MQSVLGCVQVQVRVCVWLRGLVLQGTWRPLRAVLLMWTPGGPPHRPHPPLVSRRLWQPSAGEGCTWNTCHVDNILAPGIHGVVALMLADSVLVRERWC